jgi:hypothetical protein
MMTLSIVLVPVELVVPVNAMMPIYQSSLDRRLCVGASSSSFPSIKRGHGRRLLPRWGQLVAIVHYSHNA